MCKTRWEELLKFMPPEDHTIQAWGLDEDEEIWEDKPQNLFDFLLNAKPCPFKGVPRALHCILVQDQESGEWSVHGGFLEDHENLSKVAAAKFQPGTWKILTTLTAVRHFPKWGQSKQTHVIKIEEKPEVQRGQSVAGVLPAQEPAQGDLPGSPDGES
jgi:hypothetical protein